MAIDQILDIEQGLADRLTDEWQPLYTSYMTRLLTALKMGNTLAANTIVESLSLSHMIGNLGDSLDTYTAMPFKYGCQNAAKYASATNDCHDDAISLLKTSITQNVLDQTKQASLQVIANFNTVKKAEVSILDEFQSFAGKVKSAAERNLRIAAQLHTSRLASYGFTAEANVRGITSYAVNAQLDKRGCKICRVMHGRVFQVDDARKSLQRVLKTKNPDEIASLQPWPTHKDAEAMVDMPASELVLKGWHTPPYHPNCRCMLVATKDVPSIEATPSAIASGANLKPYVPNPHDFLALGLPSTPDILKVWGDVMTKSPMKVLAKLMGIDEGLVTKDAMKTMGFKVKLSPREMEFQVNNLLHGSKNPVQFKGFIDFHHKMGSVDILALAETDAALAKDIFGETVSTFESTGLKVAAVNANIGQGSYAMAKYGYAPRDALEWERLRKNWLIKPWKKMKQNLPPMVQSTVDAILKSDDPTAIWDLADITYPVNGVPLGQKLLQDTQWLGELRFNDPTAMQKFSHYFDTTPTQLSLI